MRFRELLEAAISAPSGDNCQPWRFEVRGEQIRIFNLPDRDTSLFNYRQRASLVAHGALLENLTIAAGAAGYRAEIAFFPETASPDLVATVDLLPGADGAGRLVRAIPLRCTNRRRYDGAPLTDDERRALITAGDGLPGTVVLTRPRSEQAAVADIIALNDRLVFENQHLHAFLFDHIRWDDREARVTLDGLDIKTLDLAPPDRIMFPMLKNWPLVKVLASFGVSRIIAGNARKQAMSAGALGAVVIPDNSDLSYVNAGRIMERVWLEATGLGLSFQLMTGITFLMQRVADGETEHLSPDHVKLVRDGRAKLESIVGTRGGVAAIMFRVGRSTPPSARSLRIPLERVVSQ
ncbi:nitroreductase [Geobacter sp.]|uniref:nitroreductase n=1 Tax=Geobacter sp. TaxID=46610 RepID=UPI001ACD1E52|nr:nitroreductase [Geobacter sp.]CAG0944343.1 Putative NAD(P)H nitroreductase acg [Anaerolineae bacterium]